MERPGTDERLRPGPASEGRRDRGRIAEIGCVFSHAGEDRCHQDIEQRTNNETGDDSDRHITLRISGFLGRSRDSIESDEGEKDYRCAAHHAADPFREKRMPIGRVNHERAERYDKDDDCNLSDDNGSVRARALPNAIDQKHSHGCNDEKRRQVKSDGVAGNDRQRSRGVIIERLTSRGREIARRSVIAHQPKGKFKTKEAPAQFNEVPRPADRYRHVADRVFQNQVPADNPRDDLTEGRVRIRVGRA